jgi:hypothetical protein
MSNDRSYFMRRAAQERSAAAHAAGAKAREAHAELARRYRGLVKTSDDARESEPAGWPPPHCIDTITHKA